MFSPRQLAKAVEYHVRRARISALAVPRSVPWLRRRLHLPSNRPFEPLRVGSEPGAAVRVLEPGAIFQRPLPQFPSDSAAARPFFAERSTEVTDPAFVVTLTGGIAWGHPTGGVFTADGRFVPAFTHDPCGPDFHAVWTRLSLPSPRRIPGRVLYLVTPEASDNYHHWLIDLLPRLGQVQRAGYDLGRFDRVIVNHSGKKFQFATLERLGITADKIVTAHRGLLVQADELVVPSLKRSNQLMPPADIAFLRERFLGGLAGGTTPGRRKIFLSRCDASYRRLHNETSFHPLLRAHDFEIVSPSQLDVPAQARAFADASVIAGPAGAAFANLVFATPGSRVIEIVPPGWLAAFHWMISARVGLEHTLLLGEGEVMRGVPDVSARQRDIVLSPEKLTTLVT